MKGDAIQIKSQISITKLQINRKFQYPMTKKTRQLFLIALEALTAGD